MQSRYYDANTGRFINADGLVSAGTGFIGLNMFAYSNNNPVNMYDSSGSRAVVNEGDSSGAWYYRTNSGKAFSGEGRSHKRTTTKSKKTDSNNDTIKDVVKDSATSVATGIGDGFLENAISKVPKFTETPMDYAMTSVKYNRLPAVGKSLGKAGGLLGIASFAYDIYDDCNTYVGWDLGLAITADSAGFLAGVGIAALIGSLFIPGVGTFVAAVAIGALISAGVTAYKNNYLKKREND